MANKQSRYISDDDDDYDYEAVKEKKREKVPRFVKNGIENVDPDVIVVNLSSINSFMQKLITMSSSSSSKNSAGLLRGLGSLKNGTSCGLTTTYRLRTSSSLIIIRRSVTFQL